MKNEKSPSKRNQENNQVKQDLRKKEGEVGSVT